MFPPPMSTQLTVPVPTCIDVCALMRVSYHAFPVPPLLSIYLPVIEYQYQYVVGHHVRIFSALFRYIASQVSSIHLAYHNVNKFVLIVSNFA